VITDFGVMEPDPDSGELTLAALYPGVSAAVFAEKIGWQMRVRNDLAEVAPPAELDLMLLRQRLDPRRTFLTPGK